MGEPSEWPFKYFGANPFDRQASDENGGDNREHEEVELCWRPSIDVKQIAPELLADGRMFVNVVNAEHARDQVAHYKVVTGNGDGFEEVEEGEGGRPNPHGVVAVDGGVTQRFVIVQPR